MKRIAIMASAAALVFAAALPVMAQDADSQPAADSGKVLGTVVNGNTTTVFKAAGTKTVDMNSLKTWTDFADSHPDVARSLGANPSLMTDTGYLGKNPDLGAFFTAHPDIRDAMIANPGNYVAPTHASN